MINISFSKEEIKKLLFESEVIGHGTYGLIVKYDEDTLLKIYYKDRKSTRLNSSHTDISRMPSSA